MLDLFRSIFAPPRDLILVVASMWIGLAFAEKRTERNGISKEALNSITFYSLLGFIVGGRVLYAAENFSAFAKSPLSVLSINIDLFDVLGGLFAATLIGFVYARRLGHSFWNTLDALTPLFASLAVGLNLSHLAAGTAFGRPTDLPWSIELWNAKRHPTQIYEMLGSVVIFALIWFRTRELSPGILFLHFSALTAGTRLFLEAFRGDSTLVFEGARLAQIVAWTILAVAFYAREAICQKWEIVDRG